MAAASGVRKPDGFVRELGLIGDVVAPVLDTLPLPRLGGLAKDPGVIRVFDVSSDSHRLQLYHWCGEGVGLHALIELAEALDHGAQQFFVVALNDALRAILGT